MGVISGAYFLQLKRGAEVEASREVGRRRVGGNLMLGIASYSQGCLLLLDTAYYCKVATKCAWDISHHPPNLLLLTKCEWDRFKHLAAADDDVLCTCRHRHPCPHGRCTTPVRAGPTTTTQ